MKDAIKASTLIALGVGWAVVLAAELARGQLSFVEPSWLPAPFRSPILVFFMAIVLLGWFIPLFIGSRIFWRIGLPSNSVLLTKLLWILNSVVILIVMLFKYSAAGSSGQAGVEFRLAMIMGALSFPTGVLVAVVHNLCIDRGFFPSGRNGMLGSWALFFGAGYVQWFVLLPAVHTWFKKRAQATLSAD